ncbi:uncharacterized protein LOC143295923 [Babylonia areolata]|uniref:uncharacterized protein LOC143295923 n=1 Tax=Babylonia areolata TaxID=304850 RepID=UPI003FCF7EFB
MEKNERIELLRDVFALVHPELMVQRDKEGQREHEERKHRVQTWLNDIVQETSHEENPWSESDKGRGDNFSLLPRFMHLLRECMVTHHWTQVLSMLKCMSHIPYGADWATWKATLAAMYTEPESNVSFVQDFLKHSYLLKECHLEDVALEFVQYLISQGRTQEAAEAIKAARRPRRGTKSEYQRDLTRHTLDLLDAYQGLVFYIDWKAALHRQAESSQNNTLSQSYYSLTSSQGPSDEAVRNIARRATVGLDALVKKPGVWDIFLTKAVEIHEFYGEFDQARDLLWKYRDKNPDNPNTYRFMYDYLTRNAAQLDDEVYVSVESLDCLTSLAKLDPANPLVLTLWQKLTDEGSGEEAVRYMFDLLDFDVWQEKAEGWQCLAKSLSAGLSKKRSVEERTPFLTALTSCWSTRRDWWPEYHFTASVVVNRDQSSSSSQLLTSKVIAAAVLIGEDCHFNTEARKVLDTSSHRRLDKVLSNLDWDSVSELRECHQSPATLSPETASGRSKRPSSASPVSDDNAATPRHLSSSRRSRQKRGDKDSDTSTDADTPQHPDTSEMCNNPPSSCSASPLSYDDAATPRPASSSSRRSRQNRGNKDSDVFTDADTRHQRDAATPRPVSSSSRRSRLKRGNKDSDTSTDTDTPRRADTSEMRNNPLSSSGNSVQESDTPPSDDSVPTDNEHSLDSVHSCDDAAISTNSTAVVDCESRDLNNPAAGDKHDTAGVVQKGEVVKGNTQNTDTVDFAFKIKNSDVSNFPVLESQSVASSPSSRRKKKRIRGTEDADEEDFVSQRATSLPSSKRNKKRKCRTEDASDEDFVPAKQRRTELSLKS